MNFPTNVKYTKEHEWIRLEGDVAYVSPMYSMLLQWKPQ